MSPRPPGRDRGRARRGAPALLVASVALLLGRGALAAPAASPTPPTPPRTATTAAMPPPGAMTADDDVEDVEPVEDVMAVSASPGAGPAAAPGGGKKPSQGGLGRALPRLHAAFVHFPIAWLVLLLLIDVRTVAWGKPGWERLGLGVLGLTLVSLVIAAVTGLLRADQLPRAPDTAALIVAHRNLALLTLGFAAVAFALRLARRNRLTGPWRWAYLGLLAAAAGLVLVTGHRGAALVFGPGFLGI